jgi:hypothetical protein
MKRLSILKYLDHNNNLKNTQDHNHIFILGKSLRYTHSYIISLYKFLSISQKIRLIIDKIYISLNSQVILTTIHKQNRYHLIVRTLLLFFTAKNNQVRTNLFNLFCLVLTL